ncbi:MAG: protein kinase domain-containing protein [Roseateles asaccharophilus]|uniref:Serine/threonine protein kinase n=1 Tax=Roseateles asaccharophilus TaxID=582607 RepID=A0A4R6N942_9BURK|nr:serine/threonine protein kinase [Roseateles asaccharophilus]MDN3543832.1 HDOD domain-containing protein [Roseateles asaccharophilus]TDP11790.1 serine/threonine protein kinase [Roseateles asaccharophilus]
MSSTPPVAPTLPPALGRFRLLRELGKGAQATVWLAHDPHLDREVALKVLNLGGRKDELEDGLHEARAVSRLQHPNIVQVFEADVQVGQAYLVFEYVPGPTLAQRLRSGSRLGVRESVELMLGVLDGLAAAHAAGVVHRDLKPSNILLDARARPRVMDFGIAARADRPGSGAQGIVGTPGYISPEAARGEAPSASMDIFAAAVVLAEMLAGQRLVQETEPWRAVRLAIEQDLHLPSGLEAAVDDKLRAIVQRGLARDPAQRWSSARDMHDALQDWLHPAAATTVESGAAATLEFLLRRMRHKSDFPAMSDAVQRIQRLTHSENENLHSLANEILKDVALTHKLLRLVNSAQFSHAGGGSISTVSRAAALIGFSGIRNLALSLILLERMENKTHAQQLREEFLRALMAGALARELCVLPQEKEEVFLMALLQGLGRLLCEFYFPEEAQQIRQLQGGTPPITEVQAAMQVLGLSYEQLGQGVARQWGLPDKLLRGMDRPSGEPPMRLLESPIERQRWLVRAANDVSDLILRTEPEQAHARLKALAQRYSRALGSPAESFELAADEARQRLAQLAQAMNIRPAQRSAAQRLLAPIRPTLDDSLSPHELHATMTLVQGSAAERASEAASDILAAGIQDITNAMVENFRLNEVLRMILETIYRSLGFRRVVFCLRDPRNDTLTGRFGLGEGVETVAPLFRVPLRPGPDQANDLFAAVCQKGVDTLITDASVPKIAQRLPAWFLGAPKAASFLILPMSMKGAPFAMIYADKAETGGIALGDKELSLLRTLRNQAVMAFKQAA